MAQVVISGSKLGNALQQMLMADEIAPGAQPSYQLAKTIYVYHPLGAKLAEMPIKMAQSQPRKIAIPDSPETRVREAFEKEWLAIGADKLILNLGALARVYGIASIGLKAKGVSDNTPLKYDELYKLALSFNVFDPLNTAGSLVLNQNPNAIDFQHVTSIAVSGSVYHPSRTCVLMNEQPVYIEYTTSGFGYVGRSVYQRVLFPMKSFIQSMITDDMIVRKAGVIVAMIKAAGSIVDNIMKAMTGIKRSLIKEAETDNVISIGHDDKIETLDMKNLDTAYSGARKNILENIAAGDDMPAKLLNSETFAEGFGEGTEDAKHVAQFVQRFREWLDPAYKFFDEIVMYRAWNPEFYAVIQKEFPESYAKVDYKTAFFRWKNSFEVEWPSLLEEPPSEQVKVDDVKLKAVIALVQVLMPALDPANKAAVIEWCADNFNELKLLFGSPLVLDYEALGDYLVEQADNQAEALKEPAEPKPFSAADSALADYDAAIGRLSPDTVLQRRRARNAA